MEVTEKIKKAAFDFHEFMLGLVEEEVTVELVNGVKLRGTFTHVNAFESIFVININGNSQVIPLKRIIRLMDSNGEVVYESIQMKDYGKRQK